MGWVGIVWKEAEPLSDGEWSGVFGHSWAGRLPSEVAIEQDGWQEQFQVAPEEWRGSVGGYGGFERAGWSLRWGAAALFKGLSGRLSILKSWTSKWEGHFSIALDHPDHPGWHSGEWRASRPDDEAVVAKLVTAGVEWKGIVSGWWRARWRNTMSPFREDESRASLRLTARDHQLTLVIDASAEWGGEEVFVWTCRYRKKWQSEEDPLALSLVIGAAGEKELIGGVFGVFGRCERPTGGKWRLGIAQAWGHAGAPPRYITGWDRLPAQAFRKRDAQAFLRYKLPNGRMDLAVRLSLRTPADPMVSTRSPGWIRSWVQLEFRPLSNRRRGSTRRYIAHTEMDSLLSSKAN